MDEKSLQLLEFPRVRDIVAGFTTFPVSRELAGEMAPTTDRARIILWLEQSAEARALLAQESNFSLGDVIDVRSLVSVAARGKVLEPESFLKLQRTLAASRNLHSHLSKRAAEFPRLWEIASRVTPVPSLEKEISRVFSAEGEVLDSASPRLADLRQKLRSMRQEILRRLDSLVKTPHPPEYLQDTLITERDGRYVIPVKAEFRREVPGIVHDMSNTGATVFLEPFATVELGNELREAVLAEKHEVLQVLTVLSGEVGLHEATLLENMAALAELDLALAKARYAARVQAIEPQIADEEPGAGVGLALKLVAARHPLLRGKAVPLTVEVGRDFTVLVITGPNTGGKTVALKTIGLLALMAQAGLPVPAAEGTYLPVFDGVFADIGDEQSIEQTLSTFSWHMGHIVRIIQQSTRHSLVLMDELGTGTGPAEGAALAQAILQHFRDRGLLAVVTTHFEALKVFAHTTPGLQNAAMAFDPATLKPTYQLNIGIPGGSNALATAAQLGLPEAIIEAARSRLDKDTQQMEKLMADLAREKQSAEAARRAAETERTAAGALRRDLEEQREHLAEQKRTLLREARDAVVAQAAELSRQLKETTAELKRARSQEALQQARQTLAAAHQKLDSPAWQPPDAAATPRADAGEIRVGDRVWMTGTNLQGIVLNMSDKDGQIEVQAGAGRFRLSRQNVTRIAENAGAALTKATGVTVSVGRGIESLELDLRGRRADEVTGELDSYLNNASLYNVTQVRIIHGHGTGVVRQIVRDFLSAHPLVRSFRPGERDEGGDGVTVVKL